MNSSVLFFAIGVILLVRTVPYLIKIQTFSFKTRHVRLKENIVMLLTVIGVIFVLYGLIKMLF